MIPIRPCAVKVVWNPKPKAWSVQAVDYHKNLTNAEAAALADMYRSLPHVRSAYVVREWNPYGAELGHAESRGAA